MAARLEAAAAPEPLHVDIDALASALDAGRRVRLPKDDLLVAEAKLGQARCAMNLQQITEQMQAIDRKLPELRRALAALETQKSAAAAREAFQEAQLKKDQIAQTTQEIEQAERLRAERAERRTEAVRRLRDAEAEVARRVDERQRAAEAERVRKARAVCLCRRFAP